MAAIPSRTGICTSISTRSKLERSSNSTASCPLFTTVTRCPRFSSRRAARRWLTTLSSAIKTPKPCRGTAVRRSPPATAAARVCTFRRSNARTIASRNSFWRTGFVSDAERPSCWHRAKSPLRPAELNIMMVAAAVSGMFRILSTRPNPSILGMRMSVSINRNGLPDACAALISASASSPLFTQTTFKPHRVSSRSRMRRFV